jgi:hypothetical protein
MLMPYLRSFKAVQEPPPFVDCQPPLVPKKLLVENNPEFTVAVLTLSNDIVQVVEAKEIAMA